MIGVFKIYNSGERVYGLDILRAIAILFVVLEHSIPYVKGALPQGLKIPIFDGVSFFFVLSGFLIGGILLKTIDKNGASFKTLQNFWIRRWYRTLPAYFLVLIILILISIPSKKLVGISLIEYFLFVQNFNSPHPNFFVEAWSLSIEEWFYLITPSFIIFLMNVLKISARKIILFTALFFILLITLIRIYKLNTIDIHSLLTWDSLIKKQVVTRLDSLMYGVLGAYVSYYFKDLWTRKKELLFFMGISLIVFHKLSFTLMDQFKIGFDNLYHSVFSFHIISLGTLLVLPFLSQLKSGTGTLYKFTTHISLVSYSMYLVNLSLIHYYLMPVVFSFIPVDDRIVGSLIQFFTYWGLNLMISTLMYKFFEVPVMNLRDRFARS
ncbi:MAG: acyltransferase [Cyclobacteriaceae bacterium]